MAASDRTMRFRSSADRTTFRGEAPVPTHRAEHLIGLPLPTPFDTDGEQTALLSHHRGTLQRGLGHLARQHLPDRARAVHLELRTRHGSLNRLGLPAVQELLLRC